MSDTQWPRYQVFVQERPGQPHQDAGSVHAPDAELALFNARDVFARRPECVGMWVVPVQSIFSKTAQELVEWTIPDNTKTSAPEETYWVSCKRKHNGSQMVVGTVDARSPEEALQKAVEIYSTAQPGLAWWVFPACQVTQSDPDDADSLYSPALDKPFRLSTDFHTVSAMRQIKSPGQNPDRPNTTENDDACAI